MPDSTSDKSTPARVTVYGRSASPASYAIRDFLHRSDVPFEWVEIHDEAQAHQVGLESVRDRRMPLCVFEDGTRMENPSIRQIVEKLGWFHTPSCTEFDLAIYGAGPAGLSAAVYGASEGLKTVVVERYAFGGQAASSPKIENYLGFPSGISGADLAERAREQACRFGAEMLLAREGVHAEFKAGKRVGYLQDGTKVISRAAICATGIEYRRLGLPAETKFQGRGLYYGAGASEAELCSDEHVFIIGGGNSAGQAALTFARAARKVTLVVRGASLRSSLSAYLIDRLRSAKSIEVLKNTEVVALSGDEFLREVTLRNLRSGEQRSYPTQRVFVCIGGAPNTHWAEEVGVVRDEAGYLLTGPDLFNNGHAPQGWPLERPPYYLETNVPGLFAAGDVRHGSIKRCASAVGEGAMAVSFVHRYLSSG